MLTLSFLHFAIALMATALVTGLLGFVAGVKAGDRWELQVRDEWCEQDDNFVRLPIV